MKKIILSFGIAALVYACGSNTNQEGTANNTATVPEANVASDTIDFTVNAISNGQSEISYDPKELNVKPGSKVRIKFVNNGKGTSNIVIVKSGAEKKVVQEAEDYQEQNYYNSNNPDIIVGSPVVEPGGNCVMVFTAPEVGLYKYICTYPGGYSTETQGSFIVK